MIIGIDESGSFSLKEKRASFLIAAHVFTPDQQKKLTTHLEAWKSNYPKNNKGEIKGSSITGDQAKTFFKQVIKRQGKYFYITVHSTGGLLHTEKTLEFHKNHHLSQLDEGIRECKEYRNMRLAKQYVDMRNWFKKLNHQQLLKIYILKETVFHSFRDHVFVAALTKRDQTLGHIEISIDKDFIREPQHVAYWKDLLRSWFYSFTYRNPIPILENWPEDHPFFMAKKRGKRGSGPFVDEDHVFRRACNFTDSHRKAEIQVADILARMIAEGLAGSKDFLGVYN